MLKTWSPDPFPFRPGTVLTMRSGTGDQAPCNSGETGLSQQQTFGAVRYRSTTGTVVPDNKENLPPGSFNLQPDQPATGSTATGSTTTFSATGSTVSGSTTHFYTLSKTATGSI